MNPATEECARPEEQGASARLRERVADCGEDLRRFAAGKLGPGADADDIAQQALAAGCAKLGDFRGKDPRGWLFSIARRLLIDLYRDRERANLVPIDDEALQRTEGSLHTSMSSVEEHCVARERIQCCLDCLLTRLPLQEQVAVLLTDVHGYTNPEAAARLRMTMPSFKFMLHKARARLHAAALNARPGRPCALVSKTGARDACPGCGEDKPATARANGNGSNWRSGLDETAMTELRRELMEALVISH
jgi:RNA polymerase sigma factor (sigma-70 family)